MQPLGGYFVLCGYIVGLLLAPSLGWPWNLGWLLAGWLVGAIAPRVWKGSPKAVAWVCVGVVGFWAGLYFQARQPLPAETDISHFVTRFSRGEAVRVWGRVEERPQLTRADRARFRFTVSEVRWHEGNAKRAAEATGSLYVTMPLLQVTGLGTGDRAELLGRLYLPRTPTNPGQFDFQRFLAKQGIWAGLAGESIDWETVEDRASWLEAVRQRIVRAHVEGLGVPSGLLMSAMTMGRWSVDVPYELRDRLTDLGLAHALAASGFHVGIILTNVLKVAGGSPRFQFGTGSIVLVLYSALAGFQPSVCRAAFMGWAGVLGKVLQRRVRSSGTLLAIAFVLLLWNPLLVWDLGFQLSFLATFGLIVSTEPIARLFALTGLPVGLGGAIAAPIAATVWTLPIQVYVFNVVSPVAIPVNFLAGEVLGIVTTVGFFSGVAAVVSPALGSAIARGLAYPMRWLLGALTWVHDRVGRPWFVQQIELWQVLAMYGVLVGLWLWSARSENIAREAAEREATDDQATNREADRLINGSAQSSQAPRFWETAVGAIASFAAWGAIVFAPAYWQRDAATELFVLDTASAPVVVVRDRAEVATIGGSHNSDAITFALLPMFRELGINELAASIDVEAPPTDDPEAAVSLAAQFPVAHSIAGAEFSETGPIGMGNVNIEPLGRSGNLRLRMNAETWIVLLDGSQAAIEKSFAALAGGEVSSNAGGNEIADAAAIDVVCWSGSDIAAEVWTRWQPRTAIAVDRVSPETATLLESRGIELWEARRGAIVARDGALQRAVGGRQSTDWSL
ncbi:MAG: ComEC/Rec2 family competence protein [Geitlerinemataceae cyanobacterium]